MRSDLKENEIFVSIPYLTGLSWRWEGLVRLDSGKWRGDFLHLYFSNVLSYLMVNLTLVAIG